MTRVMLFVIALALCVGVYYCFFAGNEGLLGNAGSFEEAQEDFADIRPAETVWTPEMNDRQASAEKKT